MANTFLVSFGLLAIISVALTLKRIEKGDPNFQNICPRDVRFASVPMKDPCVLNKYVMCVNGTPEFMRLCPHNTPHFDPTTGRCNFENSVPFPPQCSGKDDLLPQTCDDGALNIANKTTCRWYIACAEGKEVPMPCQNGSYFIGDNCKPYTYHYADALPPKMLKHCQDLDRSNPLPGFRDAAV